MVANRVRPAVPADLPALVDVFWTVAAEGIYIGREVPFDREAASAAMAARIDPAAEEATILVADPGGAGVLGWLSTAVEPYGVASLGMALLPAARGQGLGTELMEAVMAWAPGAGAHKLWLEVWPHNTVAIALYRKMGFTEEGRKVRHYRRRNGELWDSVMMGRSLPPAGERPGI